MRPRVEGLQRHHLVGCGEGGVGARLVTGLPCVGDVVGLALLLVTDERGIGLQAALRGDDHGELVVVDVDEREGVAGDVRVGGDHRRHFLPLVADLVGGEDRLGVAGQRRHPRQVVRRHQLAGDDGDHTVERLRLAGVDRDDPGVGQRRSEDGHVEHPGEDDVVHIATGALDEAVVLLATNRMTDTPDLGSGARFHGGGHAISSILVAAIVSPAAWMAVTMVV